MTVSRPLTSYRPRQRQRAPRRLTRALTEVAAAPFCGGCHAGRGANVGRCSGFRKAAHDGSYNLGAGTISALELQPADHRPGRWRQRTARPTLAARWPVARFRGMLQRRRWMRHSKITVPPPGPSSAERCAASPTCYIGQRDPLVRVVGGRGDLRLRCDSRLQRAER